MTRRAWVWNEEMEIPIFMMIIFEAGDGLFHAIRFDGSPAFNVGATPEMLELEVDEGNAFWRRVA